jgi:hypothetical protein
MISLLKNARPIVGKKQDRLVVMVRKHREIQDRIMVAYRRREIEFLKRIQAEMLREDNEDDERASRVHG